MATCGQFCKTREASALCRDFGIRMKEKRRFPGRGAEQGRQNFPKLIKRRREKGRKEGKRERNMILHFTDLDWVCS